MPPGHWIGPSRRDRSALTMPWRESSSKSSFPEKCCSTFRWTEPRIGPDAEGGIETQTEKNPRRKNGSGGRGYMPDVQQNLCGQSSHARVRHEFSLPVLQSLFSRER